jgi:ATP-dependent exoDNAse (exonuclease V) alpha subunit
MLMELPELSVVRLTTNRYRDRGVGNGAIGVIVLVHHDAYEVEFSRPDGTTIDSFAVQPSEVTLVSSPRDVVAEQSTG